MENQVFFESVIRMYGGVEPLAEELLNEIGDKVDSDMHRVLSRIVLRNHRYDKDNKKYSQEVLRTLEIKSKQPNATLKDKIDYANMRGIKKNLDEIEPSVTKSRKTYIKNDNETLVSRAMKELEKHGTLPKQIEQDRKEKEEYAKDASSEAFRRSRNVK